MPHVRTQLREAAIAAVTGLQTTGDRVVRGRKAPREERDMPCLQVAVNGSDADSALTDEVQRELEVVFSCFAMGSGASDDLDDALDQMAMEVEMALAIDPLLGGACTQLVFKGDRVEFEELQKITGRIDLMYQATVFTAAGNPGQKI